MSDVDAGYGPEDEYHPGIPVPRIDLGGAIRRGWNGVFGGWRPEMRAVAAVVLAVYGVGLAANLLTIDGTVSNFFFWLNSEGRVTPGVNASNLVVVSARLLASPADLLITLGAVALLLRRAWGLGLALAGLGLLVLVDLAPPVVTLLREHRGVLIRPVVASMLFALVPIAVGALLLAARGPREDA